MRNLAVVLMLVLLVSLACSPPVEQPPVTPEVDVEQAELGRESLDTTLRSELRTLSPLICLEISLPVPNS